MEKIQLDVDSHGEGAFHLLEDAKEMGEMVVSLSPSRLIVHHTEVSKEAEGKGYAKKLLETMASYAREHHLKVIPVCPYVLAQFKRNRQAYADLWNNDEV
jgi:predicted GNAT family acetyltransferase